jgi:macrolide transport system ATP-binding/permease protein
MFSSLIAGIRALFRRDRRNADIQREVDSFLLASVDDKMRSGMSRDQALRRARAEIGSSESVRHKVWSAGWESTAESLLHDIRFALRQLRKTPGFTVTAVLTLTLGIGANAAIFTLVNAVLLRNLPVADPASLIRLGNTNQCCVGSGFIPDDDSYSAFSTSTWQQMRKDLPEFQELAAMESGFAYRPVTVRRDGSQEPARSVMGEFVSGNYFRTFGLTPASGRLFADADDNSGAPMVAVMSYENWHDNYASDPSVVGSTFWINTKPVVIAGIAPRGFYGDRLASTPPDYYMPIQTMGVVLGVDYVSDPRTQWLYIVGRVRPGVALGPLQAKVNGLFRQIIASDPVYASEKGRASLARAHTVLSPAGGGIQTMQKQYNSDLHMLMWVSGLVLLIACANIANLLLVRGMNRKPEISLRTALGAARSRVIRQLLTESLVLSTISGIAGLAIAYLGTRALIALTFPGDQNVPIDASPSLPVLLFACSLCLVTGVLFGVAPAWIASHAHPADALRTGSRTTSRRGSLLQRSLVVLQAALSLILLIGAGLFAQSLNKLQSTDLKLDARNRYIVHINPQAAGYRGSQLGPLYQAFDDRFHAIPGVVHVSWATYTPMEDNNWGSGFRAEGIEKGFGASTVYISPEYFDSVGTRLLSGRVFTRQDSPTAPTMVIVNKTLVNDVFPKGTNPIGKRLANGNPKAPYEFQIVGVVDDTPYESVRWKDHSMVFFPILQRPASNHGPIDTDSALYAGAIVIQTAHPMPDMESIARQTLTSINPNLAIVKFQTFEQQISDNFTEERLIARLTTLFGALALLLATVGLYGVTAYTVARQTGEIGIRMALGAERLRVVGMVLRGAMIQTALGLAIGIPTAYFCVHYIESQLYEVKGVNPAILLIAVGILVLAAVLAGFIPARRAASIDPASALRIE